MDSLNRTTTLPGLFAATLERSCEKNALAFAGEKPMTYSEVNDKILSLISFLEKNHIKPGDKVAILGSNMPNWGISFYAVTFMGAVAVPVLPDFTPEEISNVINHSESKFLFISSVLLPKIESISAEMPETIVLIENYAPLKTRKDFVPYSENGRPAVEYKVTGSNIASIIYTSGTTGKSKGVMLTHGNISFTAISGS